MIKWLVVKFGTEISLDVDDCETYAVLQFKSVVDDRPDLAEKLKLEVIGKRCFRIGSVDESFVMNAFDLSSVVRSLESFMPRRLEGAEIYARHKHRPLNPKLKY